MCVYVHILTRKCKKIQNTIFYSWWESVGEKTKVEHRYQMCGVKTSDQGQQGCEMLMLTLKRKGKC